MSVTASKIPDNIREMVLKTTHGYCGAYKCYEKATEIHHRISNSISNVSKYPLFINSIFNLVPTCRHHHLDGDFLSRCSVREHHAMLYETYLASLATKWYDIGNKEALNGKTNKIPM